MDHHQGRSGGTEGEAPLRRLLLILLAVAAGLASPAAFSTDEAGRRLAALIQVMQADLERATTAGQNARLLENASLLPVMAREVGARPQEVAAARSLYDFVLRHESGQAAAVLRQLAQARPFSPLPSGIPQVRALALGRSIHRAACAGCHDVPQAKTLLPAENLFHLACKEAAPALEARLLLGVKGMAAEGHRNPFSPDELAALAAWYRKNANSGCRGLGSKP
ncbi:MAG: cytochrome c [Pseudomonadota bacterium]